MFWGLVSSVLSVLNTFAYQRAISAGLALGANSMFRVFFNNVIVILLVVAAWAGSAPFSWTVSADLSPYFSRLDLLFFGVLASVSGILSSSAGQYAYANEKAGTLAPYSETGRLLTVVLGFFLFSNSPLVTLVSALVAIFAILVFSVDFRSLSVNRYCAVLAASGLLRAVAALATGYVVLSVAPFAITLFDVSFAAVVCAAVLFRTNGFPKFDRPKFAELAKWTAVNDAIWIATFVISLFLLKNLGIVAASLLGMLTLVLTVVFDSMGSRRLPEWKTALLATVVAASVTVGSLYR